MAEAQYGPTRRRRAAFRKTRRRQTLQPLRHSDERSKLGPAIVVEGQPDILSPPPPPHGSPPTSSSPRRPASPRHPRRRGVRLAQPRRCRALRPHPRRPRLVAPQVIALLLSSSPEMPKPWRLTPRPRIWLRNGAHVTCARLPVGRSCTRDSCRMRSEIASSLW